MGLPVGEQRVLDTIGNELRITDQQLAAAFAAFNDSPAARARPSRSG